MNDTAFKQFLNYASSQIATWPKWKREIAERIVNGGSMIDQNNCGSHEFTFPSNVIAEQAGRIKRLESQLAEATKPLRWRPISEPIHPHVPTLVKGRDGFIRMFNNENDRPIKLDDSFSDGWLPLSELTGHHEVTDAPR